MRAIELHQHFRQVGRWVDWDGGTCDGFKAGDPETTVTGIAVGWISTLPALQEAISARCNLFITHEPTYYNHMDNDESVFSHAHARAKRDFLRRSGLVVYRCHDLWDCMPDIGIPDAWAQGLGLAGPPLRKGPVPDRPPKGAQWDQFYAVYRVERQPVIRLAYAVLDRVRVIGQETVQLVGDPERIVESVGIGTGAICNVQYLAAEFGAGAVIATDDGMSFWRDGAWCLDRGTPLLVVNHATAEEWGMDTLARYLAQHFPEVPIHRVRQGCLYRCVGAAQTGEQVL